MLGLVGVDHRVKVVYPHAAAEQFRFLEIAPEVEPALVAPERFPVAVQSFLGVVFGVEGDRKEGDVRAHSPVKGRVKADQVRRRARAHQRALGEHEVHDNRAIFDQVIKEVVGPPVLVRQGNIGKLIGNFAPSLPWFEAGPNRRVVNRWRCILTCAHVARCVRIASLPEGLRRVLVQGRATRDRDDRNQGLGPRDASTCH